MDILNKIINIENKKGDRLILIKHITDKKTSDKKTYSFLVSTKLDGQKGIKLFGFKRPVKLIMACFNIVHTTRLKKILINIGRIDTEAIFKIDERFWDVLKIYSKQIDLDILEIVAYYKVSKKIIEIDNKRKNTDEVNFSREAKCS